MDERARHFRRLNRLRGSARRWSVLGGGLAGAAVVLTPYAGIGAADAAWAAAAGASLALAGWRWSDHRALARQPVPPAVDPALAGQRLIAAVERFAAGRAALREMRRHRVRYELRGSAVVPAWNRFDRAAVTMAALAGRLSGPGEAAVSEAAVAEQWLRDLALRIAGVERAVPLAPGEQQASLREAHQSLLAQYGEGVAAYEGLVAAAARYVAEEGRPAIDRHPSLARLTEAAELMRGVAEGLAELRSIGNPRVA
jgi:hypothetical protein